MSGPLIILTGLAYLCVCVDQIMQRNYSGAMVYFGYSFSNVGLWIMVGK